MLNRNDDFEIQFVSSSTSSSDYCDKSTSSLASCLASISRDSFLVTDLIIRENPNVTMPLRGQPVILTEPTDPIAQEDWDAE